MLRLSFITLAAFIGLAACDDLPGPDGTEVDTTAPPALAACPAEWVGEATSVAGASFPNIAGVAIVPAGFPDGQALSGTVSVNSTSETQTYACGSDGVQGCTAPTTQLILNTADGQATVELSIPAGQLALLPTESTVTATASADEQSGARLLLTDAQGPLLLAVSHRGETSEFTASDDFDFGPLEVSFGTPSCKMERDFCLIAHRASPLRLTANEGEDSIDVEVPAETSTGITFQGVTYRVHHARSVEPIYEEGACGPSLKSRSDFWIMRIPSTDS